MATVEERKVRAMEEMNRNLKQMVRVMEAVNVNLVYLGRYFSIPMEESKPKVQIENNPCKHFPGACTMPERCLRDDICVRG